MGKKRITTSKGDSQSGAKNRSVKRLPRKKISKGNLYVLATFNNTCLTVTDEDGNVVMWENAGTCGFKGTRKSTPYAASKAGSILGEKAKSIGITEVGVVIKGVGPGRESAVRSFVNQGIGISFIKDATPLPHNGPKPPKPRRV